MVMHRTSVALDNALYESWRQSGLPLADLIRRGLATLTAAPAAPGIDGGSVVNVLLRIEAQFADLLDRMPGFIDADDAEPLTPEEYAQRQAEWERQHEQQERERAERWRGQLVAPDTGGEVVLTVAEAAVRLRVGEGTARSRLRRLEGYELAQRIEGDGQTHAHRWRVPRAV